ncbi:BglG family transcription antiterminator [Staphylococcus arlettae]|uniref:BglG family transcription antiterminator n=1 Tax=Staphylococcus arlettae TaxID=29378 RepID=UPI0021D32F9B|nr:PRD domain-containing protein [Staphylococcus arlettae]UXU50086.1 PRD domain-containing protein [Staphylococcus arlettae]
MEKEDKISLIINHLLNNTGYIKAEEMAELLTTSTKSIYRLIKEINSRASVNQICAERGKGFYINPQFSGQDALLAKNNDEHRPSISPIERRNEITKDLLINSPQPITVNNIIHQHYISESILTSDEKYIIQAIKCFDLQLIRENRNLSIVGDENNIRTALMQYMESLNIAMDSSNSIPKNLKEKDLNFVHKQFNIIEKVMNVKITYPYNVNIVSHLYILILRFRKHGAELKQEKSDKQLTNISFDHSYYRVCDMIIKNFEQYLSSDINDKEKEHLYKYLISYRVEHVDDIYKEQNFPTEVQMLTKQLLKRMSKSMHQNFDNPKFYIDLMKHIQPMSNRLNNGIVIKNTLLNQIKYEYYDIFMNLTEVMQQMLPAISEDEIGFLTLYFAKEIERNPKKVKTLITSTTGIGTSELLRVKVEKNLPEIEVVDVISTDFVDETRLKEIDLIISTVNIEKFERTPVIIVSAMFNKSDQQKLKQLIEKMGV